MRVEERGQDEDEEADHRSIAELAVMKSSDQIGIRARNGENINEDSVSLVWSKSLHCYFVPICSHREKK